MDAVTLALAKKYTDSRVGESKIYGVYWDKGSSPVLTRTNDAVGLTAAVGVDGVFVINDFDNAQIYREIGEIKDTLGNVFVRIPKFYIRKTDGPGFKTLQISKTQYPGFYLPWIFWDFVNGRELPYYDHGKYKATKDGTGKLESKPNLYPLIRETILNFRTYARNNNVGGLLGYQQLDIHAIDVLQTLFTIEFATLDSQSIMQGFTKGVYLATHLATVSENNVNRIIVDNANAVSYQVGQAISVGTSLGGNQVFYGRTITSIDVYDVSNKAISFDGAPVNIAIGNILYNTGWKNGFSGNIAASSGSLVSNSNGLYPCVYRGIESPFGDIYQFVDGVNINERQAWVAKNEADYASNVFASPYEVISYVNSIADGYVKEIGFDGSHPFAQFPTVSAGGSSTTYYSDYYYQSVGQKMAIFGGGWPYDFRAGFSSWNMNLATVAVDTLMGGRLLKKPL